MGIVVRSHRAPLSEGRQRPSTDWSGAHAAQSAPAGNYVAAVRSGNLLFLSGKGPSPTEGVAIKGQLGREFSAAEGYSFAQSACLEILAVIQDHLGSLDLVKHIVEVHGFLNAVPAIEDHARVLDGASDLMVEVFGPAGVHARSVIGVSALRKGLPLTIKAIVEVKNTQEIVHVE
jgi:enamine deaminase RidA (YjgF/YER057c/UK114 family)